MEVSKTKALVINTEFLSDNIKLIRLKVDNSKDFQKPQELPRGQGP